MLPTKPPDCHRSLNALYKFILFPSQDKHLTQAYVCHLLIYYCHISKQKIGLSLPLLVSNFLSSQDYIQKDTVKSVINTVYHPDNEQIMQIIIITLFLVQNYRVEQKPCKN